jgi:hypothetical protein
MKQWFAKMEEQITIKKYASLPRTSNKAMLCEISQNILSSTQPHAFLHVLYCYPQIIPLQREKEGLTHCQRNSRILFLFQITAEGGESR